MQELNGTILNGLSEPVKDTKYSADNQAAAFLHEYKDVISHAVFLEACDLFNKHIQTNQKLLEKIYEDDLLEDEELFGVAKLLEQHITESIGFMDICKHIFEILANKCFNALNLDATKFEEHKHLQLACTTHLKHINILLLKIAFLEERIDGLEVQHDLWMENYKLLLKKVRDGKQAY